MIESTIRNVAVLNLLEDFGPDGCVTSPVGLDGGGLRWTIWAIRRTILLCLAWFLFLWFGIGVCSGDQGVRLCRGYGPCVVAVV